MTRSGEDGGPFTRAGNAWNEQTLPCKHRDVSWSDEHDKYLCRGCGLEICTDCGTTPSHEDSSSRCCRRCTEKGGCRFEFVTAIDHDLLRAKVGRELAEAILSECRDV